MNTLQEELQRNVMNLNKADSSKKSLEAKMAQYEERIRQTDSVQVKNCGDTGSGHKTAGDSFLF